MRIEIKTPEFSESVQSGSLLEWRKKPGDPIKRDETLADLETDKVILEISAPQDGVLSEIRIEAGQEVKSGDVLAIIETEADISEAQAQAQAPAQAKAPAEAQVASSVQPEVHLPPSARKTEFKTASSDLLPAKPDQTTQISPPTVSNQPLSGATTSPSPLKHTRTERREPMSRLRLRIAERLLEAQHNAAMLTTFNEIDMQPVQELRARYQERFQKEYGVKLGFMSFFIKAACQALKQYPVVNARLDGRDIVFHDYYDIGVAVSSARGLVVPVLRDAIQLSFAGIEKKISDFSSRANNLELTLEELQGGTFTISNGGVFGSLMSTPILNPPQSGVLGLHKIQDRPIAMNGQVVIRPMMYVALSYDHRLIDGREAVSFLRSLKEAMEDPARLLLEL